MEIHCSIPFKSLSKKLDGNFLLFKMARASSITVILPALFSFFSMLGKIASKLLHSPPAKIRLQWLGDSYTANHMDSTDATAPPFGSYAPKTKWSKRACRIAPQHIGQGSNVT